MNMQTSPPPSLRSGHLDIKDAQCAKKMMGIKFHITSYRICMLQPFKRGVLVAQKLNFIQNWSNLQGKHRGRIGPTNYTSLQSQSEPTYTLH